MGARNYPILLQRTLPLWHLAEPLKGTPVRHGSNRCSYGSLHQVYNLQSVPKLCRPGVIPTWLRTTEPVTTTPSPFKQNFRKRYQAHRAHRGSTDPIRSIPSAIQTILSRPIRYNLSHGSKRGISAPQNQRASGNGSERLAQFE